MTISIGADPEFFLYNPHIEEPHDEPMSESEDWDGEGEPPPPAYVAPHGYLPCVGIIPGTKEEPHQLANAEPGFFVHDDNVCVEVGWPPTNDPRVFTRHAMLVKDLVQSEFLDRLHYELAVHPAIKFMPDQLNTPQARSAGCEPDYDAYTSGKVRSLGPELMKGNWRFAAGHVHLGGDFNCPPFVVALFADIFLHLQFMGQKSPASFYNPDWQRRAEWYGRPGIFRPKPYGIEYRSPSNWWMKSARACRTMGNAAASLCHYLEKTSATNLRIAVQQIDWLALQTFLAEPPRNQVERLDKQQFLMSECLKYSNFPDTAGDL